MIRGGVGRKLPSVFQFYSSVASRSSSPLQGFANSGVESGQQWEKNQRTPLTGNIVSRIGISGFSRGFVAIGDAGLLIVPLNGVPPTVAALKNPSNWIVYDEVVHERYPPSDPSKRAFTYFVLTGGRFIYASALRLMLLKFVLSHRRSKRCHRHHDHQHEHDHQRAENGKQNGSVPSLVVVVAGSGKQDFDRV